MFIFQLAECECLPEVYYVLLRCRCMDYLYYESCHVALVFLGINFELQLLVRVCGSKK